LIPDRMGNGFGPIAVASVDGNCNSFLSKRSRDGFANADAAAGDEGTLTAQLQVQDKSSPN
jgi:hypothetical protein